MSNEPTPTPDPAPAPDPAPEPEPTPVPDDGRTWQQTRHEQSYGTTPAPASDEGDKPT